jgi:hypothetical protein
VSTNWRRRMLEQHGAETDEYLDGLGTEDRDDSAIEADHRRSQLHALRELDPSASLDEELQIRLIGDQAAGALRFDWGDAMLRPLQESVSKAARKPVGLALTGVSQGSTVLHVRPVALDATDGEGLARVDSSLANEGVRTLISLLHAIEGEADVRQWRQLFDPVDALAGALDRFDLTLALKWLAADGAVQEASLTRQGCRYVKRLRQTRETQERTVVSGRITELRSSGVVKVKSGVSSNSPAFEVRFDPDQLLSMQFVLGANVHFVVEQRRSLDAVGRTRTTEHYFLREHAEERRLGEDGAPA